MAAQAALSFVQNGMAVGLGTGTTSAIFIQLLAKMAKEKGWKIRGVATSVASGQLARSLGIDVISLEEAKNIDLAVDGADQIDGHNNLVKGYGGALAREKIVEYSAKKFVVIADDSKLCKFLCKPIPVEFIPFAKATVQCSLIALGAKSASLRLNPDGEPYRTDNGLWIFDADFKQIKNPASLEEKIKKIPGVLESGIFSKNISDVIVGTDDGMKKL